MIGIHSIYGRNLSHVYNDADIPSRTHCVDVHIQSGKPQFSYIYGVAALGTTAIYILLNLMSQNTRINPTSQKMESGIDAYRTASVLGYCLLPMVGLGGVGMGVGIE